MTGTVKKKVSQQERKGKSGLLSLKKKLNIPKIYRRLASKLSVHGRHIRSLTSTWNATDLQCLVTQYELTAMLKELSDAANLAHASSLTVSSDLQRFQRENYLCNLLISYNVKKEESLAASLIQTIQVHSAMFCKRTKIALPQYQHNKQTLTDSSPVHCQNDADLVVLVAEPTKLFESMSTEIKYSYCKTTRNLRLYAKNGLSTKFMKDWLSFIYGERPFTHHTQTVPVKCKRKSKIVTASEECDKLYEAHRSQQLDVVNHLCEKNKYTKPLTDHADGSSFYQSSDNEEKPIKFMEDFRSDMKDLLLSANVTGDIKLVFAVSSLLSVLSSHLRSRQPGLCCHCHSFVLAARSTFFRNIIQKQKERYRSDDENHSPFITIELDWKVFSPRYFPVVLYAMYTDEVDLQRITKTVPLISHRVARESLSTDVKDLMELLYIGQFLEFSSLIHGCENALADRLNVSNLIEMLQWSSQPHGSKWLRRQIIRYAKDNFQELLANGVLFCLSSDELAEIIRSDFVNAPELDILRAVLKWGEHELLRRIELREPNLVRSHVLLNQATRNFRVSSTRRRELLMASNTEELHDSTAALLTHVRLRHVLPANHEVLTSAIKRGVISCPPEHLLEWHHHSGATNESENAFFWLRDRAGLGFSPPRLFMPHAAEAKVILEERLCQETAASVNLKSVRRVPQASGPATPVTSSAVPDALYMVSQVRRSSRPSSIHNASCDKCRFPCIGVTSLATKLQKYIDNRYPVPSPSIASKLLARERLLRQSSWIRRTLQACHSASVGIPHCCCRSERNSLSDVEDTTTTGGLLCNLCRAERYIRLLVVREHDLPDIATDVLRRPHLYYDPDELVAVSPANVKPEPVDVLVKSPVVNRIAGAAPKRLQKLFHKKSVELNKPSSAAPADSNPGWIKLAASDHGSSSDLSLSDESNAEWPFPYTGGDMRDRGMPGSSFWGSDLSLRRETARRQTVVPDVAASADSTLKSIHSQLSSSTSDSCASVPCRLVAESRPEDEDSSTFFRGETRQSFTISNRKTSVSSYSRYLSMRKSRNEGRPSILRGATLWSPKHPEASSLPKPVTSPINSSVPELVLEGLRQEKSELPPDLCAGSSSLRSRKLPGEASATSEPEDDLPGSLFLKDDLVESDSVTESSLVQSKENLPGDRETCI